MRFRQSLLFLVDVGVGLLLAGAVAPLVLIVLPAWLRGGAFLLATSALCVLTASFIRRLAARRS